MSMISPGCLFFTGIFTWILGLTSIGLWVGCYFECPTGRDTDFNYYVAVWTGVVVSVYIYLDYVIYWARFTIREYLSSLC